MFFNAFDVKTVGADLAWRPPGFEVQGGLGTAVSVYIGVPPYIYKGVPLHIYIYRSIGIYIYMYIFRSAPIFVRTPAYVGVSS